METRNETIKHCAQIASEFTMGPDRSIHPDIPWDEMSEAAKLVAHTTAQQIAQAILQEIVEEPQARITLCINCGEPVHRATEEERQGLLNPAGSDWKHDDGFWLCGNANTKATGPEVEEPQAGKTLADFAKTRTPLFKRPMHRNPYGFTAGGDHLREIRGLGTKDTFVDFARLTAEDLTANDWEEVTEEVSN